MNRVETLTRRALNALSSDAEPDIHTARLALFELLGLVREDAVTGDDVRQSSALAALSPEAREHVAREADARIAEGINAVLRARRADDDDDGFPPQSFPV